MLKYQISQETQFVLSDFLNYFHYLNLLDLYLLHLLINCNKVKFISFLIYGMLNMNQQQKYYQTFYMEKIVRYRKAFYEKENDYKNGNQKIQNQMLKSYEHKPIQDQNMYKSIQTLSFGQVPKLKANKSNTQAFCQAYAKDLIQSHKDDLPQARFLSNHKIDASLRARMLDWMVEVMVSYKFNNKTYFASMQIMDRYFLAQTQCLVPTKLHILGVQSMAIASKMQEVFPLKLKTVFEKIGHKKIPQEDLLAMEQKISFTLNFMLNSWTFFDLAILKISNFAQSMSKKRSGILTNISLNYSSLNNSEKNIGQEILKKMNTIQQVCSYIGKHLCYDYDFMCQYSINTHSDTIIKLAFQICKIQCDSSKMFTSSAVEVELCKDRLIARIRNFSSLYKGLSNIKKFAKPQILELVEAFVL